jgi:hypothetical protein
MRYWPLTDMPGGGLDPRMNVDGQRLSPKLIELGVTVGGQKLPETTACS